MFGYLADTGGYFWGYTYDTCKYYVLYQRKSYWISTWISLSKLIRKIPKDRLSREERMVLSSSFMDVCCTTWKDSSKWNRIVVDAKVGGKSGIFDFFTDIINHLPIRSYSRVANFAGIKFCALILWSFVISPEFNFMYTLSPNFLTATRLMPLRVFLISWNRLDKNITPL